MPMTAASAYARYVSKAGASQDPALQEAAMKPLLEAIIEEIQTSGTVAVTGVTPGAGAAVGTIS